MSLLDATKIAVQSNPEIGQAIENRQATEFELKQALGLYAPRLDFEASTGAERLDNPSARAAGIQNDPLYPSQVGLVATYDVFDGGYRQSEANRQAARVDGASFRVLERSEFIALQIAREYFEIILQQRIIDLSLQNVAFHQKTLQDVTATIGNGQLTEADKQQAQERLNAARARVAEAKEVLESSKIDFYKDVGIPITAPSLPPRIGKALPNSLADAIAMGRRTNPQVLIAGADLDAASAVVAQSASGFGPKVSLEARANTGLDVGGVAGQTTDLSGRVIMKWSLFDGGIKAAQVQESAHRESEAMLAQQQAGREVEQAVRVSWDRMHQQGDLAAIYKQQLNVSDALIKSYQQQFGVGQRSLLDVLEAQNTRFSVQIQYETAQFAARFAEYRLMAASGALLPYMHLKAPNQADAYARQLLKSPSAADARPQKLTPLDLRMTPAVN
ncbi:MAG TPA: TolC family outer membrane protein [Arsenicitalea sp.]|nr:TolC family outer membrane protein [Arsenicitalea sp.]